MSAACVVDVARRAPAFRRGLRNKLRNVQREQFHVWTASSAYSMTGVPMQPRRSVFTGRATECEVLRMKIGEADQELAELQDKLFLIGRESLDAQAQHAADVEIDKKFGILEFATDMLKVADGLGRASAIVKQNDLNTDQNLRELHTKVVRLRSSITSALQDFGIQEIDAMGAAFDPSKHEAMFTMQLPGKKGNTIFHVLEPGYTLHDRTLRTAKVGVVRR